MTIYFQTWPKTVIFHFRTLTLFQIAMNIITVTVLWIPNLNHRHSTCHKCDIHNSVYTCYDQRAAELLLSLIHCFIYLTRTSITNQSSVISTLYNMCKYQLTLPHYPQVFNIVSFPAQQSRCWDMIHWYDCCLSVQLLQLRFLWFLDFFSHQLKFTGISQNSAINDLHQIWRLSHYIYTINAV